MEEKKEGIKLNVLLCNLVDYVRRDDRPLVFAVMNEIDEYFEQELDRAREEGARDVFTKDEWFMLKLAMNDIFNGGNRAYEDISNKIKAQLSKLNKKK